MAENFSTINDRQQTKIPESSENAMTDTKTPTPRCIIFKLQEVKEKILLKKKKKLKDKKLPCLYERRVRITLDFSSETMQRRRDWSKIFEC